MKFSVAHDLVTFLFAGLGLVALHLGGALSPAFGVLVAAGAALALLPSRERVVSRRYGRIISASVAALLVVQAVRAIFFVPFFEATLEFAALLQISRLAHRRTAAEYKQIAGLSILHLVAATVLYRDLGYGVIFAGYVVVTPWMFGLTQVREALEQQYRDPEGDPHEPQPGLEEVLSRRGWVGPGFFAGTAALSLALVAVTVAFFLAFPRVSGDFLGLRGGRGAPITGFGDDVSLGGFGTIRTDRRVVVRLTVERDGTTTPPMALPIVLRGTSFDHYEDGRWSRSRGPSKRASLARAPLRLSTAEEHRALTRVTVVSELDPEPVLLIPEGAVQLERASPGMGAVVNEVEYQPGVDVRALDAGASARRYSAVIGEGGAPREGESVARYLTLPPEMGRLAALARSIVGDETRPREMAEALQRHLTSGRYAYTLEQASAPGVDPMEHFLFERRAGHCEYFSTAMALMLRSLGVPSRNVTGFVGGRFNEYGGYYAIQQGDAHSWVEALIDGTFVRYDPTPPAREGHGIGEGPLTTLQAYLDSLRMEWHERVIGYDFENQRRLFSAIRAWSRSSTAARRAPRGDVDPARLLSTFSSPWVAAGALALVAAGLGWVVLRRRSPRRREAEEVRLLRALEALAARRGAARPESETPLEWARRLEAEGSPAAPAVTRGVRAFAALRYEGADERAALLDSMTRAVRELRGA